VDLIFVTVNPLPLFSYELTNLISHGLWVRTPGSYSESSVLNPQAAVPQICYATPEVDYMPT
jgi:hypothetical protein